MYSFFLVLVKGCLCLIIENLKGFVIKDYFVLGVCWRGTLSHLWDTGQSFLGRVPPWVQCRVSHFSLGKREHKRNRYAEMSGILRIE